MGSTFINFHPEALPKGTFLLHKTAHGNVDQEIRGCGELRSTDGAMDVSFAIESVLDDVDSK